MNKILQKVEQDDIVLSKGYAPFTYLGQNLSLFKFSQQCLMVILFCRKGMHLESVFSCDHGGNTWKVK